MRYKKYVWSDLNVEVSLSHFAPSADITSSSTAVDEYHAIFELIPSKASFEEQSEHLAQAQSRCLSLPEMQGVVPVFRRFFLSDAANQEALLAAHIAQTPDIATAYIQQPPLNGTKIALWMCLQRGSQKRTTAEGIVMEHNGYRHLYHFGRLSAEGSSYQQTQQILTDYVSVLHNEGCTLEGNCIRTWFFVRDVDTQYAGLVKARKDLFVQHGLTEQTHYIASTGIGGTPAPCQGIVQMDAYALQGADPQQVHYLKAPSHLNPTHEYGVTFERGTAVEYGDRAMIYISGTASIDNKGQVVETGNIINQTRRMCQNVEALLNEANASASDMAQILVYLRDMADYPVVKQMFEETYPEVPFTILLAPVCRPAWLIEMECIAIAARNNTTCRNF